MRGAAVEAHVIWFGHDEIWPNKPILGAQDDPARPNPFGKRDVDPKWIASISEPGWSRTGAGVSIPDLGFAARYDDQR